MGVGDNEGTRVPDGIGQNQRHELGKEMNLHPMQLLEQKPIRLKLQDPETTQASASRAHKTEKFENYCTKTIANGSRQIHAGLIPKALPILP